MDRPIELCEFVGLDGCCINPLNQTPECHDDACPELRYTVHFIDGTSAVIERGPKSNGIYLNGHLMPGFRSIWGFLKWVEPSWKALGWLPEKIGTELRIQRIEGFVLEKNGEVRTDLTAEQVKGNLDNLDQLAVDLMQLKSEDHLSEDDYERLNERVQALWAKLELAREEGDVPRRDDALCAVRKDGAERSAH